MNAHFSTILLLSEMFINLATSLLLDICLVFTYSNLKVKYIIETSKKCKAPIKTELDFGHRIDLVDFMLHQSWANSLPVPQVTL